MQTLLICFTYHRHPWERYAYLNHYYLYDILWNPCRRGCKARGSLAIAILAYPEDFSTLLVVSIGTMRAVTSVVSKYPRLIQFDKPAVHASQGELRLYTG